MAAKNGLVKWRAEEIQRRLNNFVHTQISIYEDTELFDRVVLNNMEEPLNPGDTITFDTYPAIPASNNSSVYNVRFRLWGNYE